MSESHGGRGSHVHDDARITPSKILRCKRGAEPSHIQKASMLFSNVNLLEELEDQVDATVQLVSAEDYCHTCGVSGKLVICELCPKVFHFNCVNPPLDEEEDDDDDEKWYCANCKTKKDMKATWERFPRIYRYLNRSQGTIFAQLLQFGLKRNPMEYNYLPPRRPPWGPLPSESPPAVNSAQDKKSMNHTGSTQPTKKTGKARGPYRKRVKPEEPGVTRNQNRTKAQKLDTTTGSLYNTKHRKGAHKGSSNGGSPVSDRCSDTESADAQVQRIVQNSAYHTEGKNKAKHSKKLQTFTGTGMDGLHGHDTYDTKEGIVQVCKVPAISVHTRRKIAAKQHTQPADADTQQVLEYQQHVREVHEGASALMSAAQLLETTKAQTALAALPADVIELFKQFRDSRTAAK